MGVGPTAADVRAQIEAAWRDAVPPAPPLCSTYDDEGVSGYFAHRPWTGHDVEALRWHSVGLSFLDPPGFRYYLATYMTAVLDDAGAGAAGDIAFSIDHSLSVKQLRMEWADRYRARIDGFTPAQRQAIAAFLDWYAMNLAWYEVDDIVSTIEFLVDGAEPGEPTGVARLLALSRQQLDDRARCTRLGLGSVKLRDGDLATLGELPALRHIDLSHTALTDAGLAHLPRAAGVTHLELGNYKQLTPAGAAHIARMPALVELALSNADLDDATLAALAPLRLEALTLTHSRRLTAAGFAALDVSRLRSLRMFGVDAPDSLLAAARALEDLQVRSLTAEGLAALAAAPALAKLDVSEAGALTPASIEVLASLPALAELDLGHLPALPPWPPGFPRLAKLSILSSALAAGALPAMPALVELRLFGDTLAPGALAAIAASPALATAVLWCDQLDDAVASDLAAAPSLRRIAFGKGALTGSCLAVLASLPALADLELAHLPALTDAALAALAAARALAHLTLADVPITDAGLAHLAALPALTRLDLTATHTTPAGISALRAARPSLTVVAR